MHRAVVPAAHPRTPVGLSGPRTLKPVQPWVGRSAVPSLVGQLIARTHARKHARKHAESCTQACTRARTQERVHTCTHARMHARTHARTHARMHARRELHTRAHADARMPKHAHVRAWVCAYARSVCACAKWPSGRAVSGSQSTAERVRARLNVRCHSPLVRARCNAANPTAISICRAAH
jgi:hypothetical protein